MDDFEEKDEGWIHAIFAVLRNEAIVVPAWDSLMERLDEAVIDQRFKQPSANKMSNSLLGGVSKLSKIRFFPKKPKGEDHE